MLSIATTYNLFTNTPLAAADVASQIRSVTSRETGGSLTAPTTRNSNISESARQMSDAHSRADARSGMSYHELNQKATSLLAQITGTRYHANQTLHDAELPDTNDATLLARAKQATDFLNGRTTNPFKGMTREQLALIAYDEGGSFTVNERRASSQEADSQEYAWRQKVVQKAMDEYNSTGKLTDFFSETLEHYENLPAIEKAQYPEDYQGKLQGWIVQDFNYKTHIAEGLGEMSATELIFSTVSKQGVDLSAAKVERVVARYGLERVVPGAGLTRIVNSPTVATA